MSVCRCALCASLVHPLATDGRAGLDRRVLKLRYHIGVQGIETRRGALRYKVVVDARQCSERIAGGGHHAADVCDVQRRGLLIVVLHNTLEVAYRQKQTDRQHISMRT